MYMRALIQFLDQYAFLDKDYLAYTMAYYGDSASEAKSADLSLEQAQNIKYQLIVERAQIEDGHSILDLGCGFGGLSKYLHEHFLWLRHQVQL